MKFLNDFFTEQHLDLKVHMIPCRKDNYSFVLELPGKTAVMIDSTLKEPVMSFLKAQSLELKAIFLTHHHYDHVDKVEDFQNEFGCQIYCSEYDSKRPDISGDTSILSEGSVASVSGLDFLTIETPGHTKSHLSFYLKEQNILFCGDTLFSLGCGRVLEPYAEAYEDFYASMQKIKNHCNEATMIYCAHEYTKANFNFLSSRGLVDEELKSSVDQNLRENLKTVPTKFSFEIKHNAFLNSKSKKSFKDLRQLKDKF
jgi:hydroxyacylglutathione hydrolase